VMNLLRLYELTNDQSVKEYAQKTLKHFCTILVQSPQVMPQLMSALDYFLSPPEHLVVVAKGTEDANIFFNAVSNDFMPNLNTILLTDSSKIFFEQKLPFTKEMKMNNGNPTAYFCKNYSCELPAHNLNEFKSILGGK